jgi:GTP-binding protein HflX
MTDTVGFISKLPHNLVKAFRSTLEEVSEADLLLHVVDYSDPNYKKHMEVTKETLKSIGVKDIPVVYVYNKVDLLQNENTIEVNNGLVDSGNETAKSESETETENAETENAVSTNEEIIFDFNTNAVDTTHSDASACNTNDLETEDIIKISSKDKEDIKKLAELIKNKLFASEVRAELLLPYDKGGLISYFNENCKVVDTKYEGEGILITIVCNEKIYEKYKQYVKNVYNN